MKIIIPTIVLIFTITSFNILNAQDEPNNSLELKTHSISLRLIGAPSWPIGVSYGQMINNRMSIELGVGLLSAGAGFDFYITNPRYHRFNLNTGIYGSINFSGFPMVYIPIGISYFGKKNFIYNLNVGGLYAENVGITEEGGDISPWFGLTLGKRFGQDVELLMNSPKTSSKNIVYGKIGALDPWFGIGYERLISPNIGIEGTIGFLGIAAGANIYLPAVKTGQIGFKSGLIHCYGANPFDGTIKGYVPFGINYLNKSNINVSLDAGPTYWYNSGEILLSFNLKVGLAF